MTAEVLVALITALAGPVSVILVKRLVDVKAEKGAKAEASPDDADPATVSQIVLDWARSLNTEVRDTNARLAALENEVSELKRENSLLRRHNEILSRQVVELGGKPWRMPE